MKRKLKGNLLLLVLLFSFFIEAGSIRLRELAALQRLNETTVTGEMYRRQKIEKDYLKFLEQTGHRGRAAGLYLLESKFGLKKVDLPDTDEKLKRLQKKWMQREAYKDYLSASNAIWNDVEYFPIPVSEEKPWYTVSYVDTWMMERTYGGKRGHEGIDIMASKNKPGLYPVVSMTKGIVAKKGWLDKGGYRVGIAAPSGGYFYYAHLSSYADIEVGDVVEAGELLGFMGDTGYGPEGTTGKFPVHLHVGIYIYQEGKEVSVNPYWILRLAEKSKLKYAYS